MNLKQQRLLDIRDQKKKGLDNEVTETLTAQVSNNLYFKITRLITTLILVSLLLD